jgi:hypothetical protein
MIYEKFMDEIFIQIANDNSLKFGDFGPGQEMALEKSINEFLNSCQKKNNNLKLKNKTKLEKYSYDLLKKIALENNFQNYSKCGKEQENIIQLFKDYIKQNSY